MKTLLLSMLIALSGTPAFAGPTACEFSDCACQGLDSMCCGMCLGKWRCIRIVNGCVTGNVDQAIEDLGTQPRAEAAAE
jgi:hypothetical protein